MFDFSATRQTAMPIRIVPRFCARGCGRFEKLLYGCRNPSLQDKTHVLAKISMLRLNIGSGMLRLSSCMLRLSLTSSSRVIGPRRPGGRVSWPPWTDEARQLSLSMPEPMLSPSMLMLGQLQADFGPTLGRPQAENGLRPPNVVPGSVLMGHSDLGHDLKP